MLTKARKTSIAALLSLVGAVTAIALAVPPGRQSYDLSWYTIDAGGDTWSTGGDFELSGTIGQPDANAVPLTGGDYELTGGFWPAAAVAPIPGDCDADGDVDLDDFADFPACLLGPGGGLGAGCGCVDLDDSGDVELADFAMFQQQFTGPLP